MANAEINEIIKSGGGRQFHDGDSNTDVLLYNGQLLLSHTNCLGLGDSRTNDSSA